MELKMPLDAQLYVSLMRLTIQWQLTAAMLKTWETPNVAQTYSKSYATENVLPFSSPRTSRVVHLTFTKHN